MPALETRSPSRAVRICGVSGSTLDRRHGFIAATNAEEQIDILVGDWMSEANMPSAQARKLSSIENGTRQVFGYEKSFLTSIEPALSAIEKKGIKVIVNAGASDAEALCTKVQEMVTAQKLSLKAAWISGDEVLPQVQAALQGGASALIDISTGRPLEKLSFEPIYAQAYLGGRGIAHALESGADIVICGRVSDASPVIGGAMWWHGWKPDQFHELAGALVAGHLIECSTYVTGGNFSGFKSIPGKEDLGFPITEIDGAGGVVITKIQKTGGAVTKDTVTAQLVYEIQGPFYYNSDVTAQLDQISLENIGPDRIKVNGVIGLPPPPTTKVGITSQPRYQAELHWSLVGLDIEAKAALLERNIRDSLGEAFLSKLHTITFSTHGVAEPDPYTQDRATVDFRVFVQTKDKQDLSYEKWVEPVLNVIMCSYPGATFQPGVTSGLPKVYHEYSVALMPQNLIHHCVHLGDAVHEIPPPAVTRDYPAQQPSSDGPENPTDLSTFGETVRGPLGWIVHARSGDKGSNANVGFWVRSSEEYEWLRSLLTVPFLKQLLGGEYREGRKIDRFELPGLWAVHFLLHDHLDGGYNSTRTYDLLGKNVAEFLRARYVDLPKRFLEKGKI